MGLDMYLTKHTYVWDDNKKNLKIEGIEGIKPKRVSHIVEDIGYWRKANAIHRWFVENVQDGQDNCEQAFVSTSQLAALLDLVNAVLKDHSLAPKLLPTQEGFFFGSTEYDEYYFKDLEATRTIIENALKEKDADIRYQSSW
jgi:hypothetical protein